MKCKMIYQHDDRDCGAASLAMILSCHGLKLPLARCREITYTDQNGTNIYGIMAGAREVGMQAEGLTGTLDELVQGIQEGEFSLPIIAHVVKENMQGHFVVITKVYRNKVYILDPGKGKRKLSLKAFSEIWTGNIVVFSKTEKFIPQNLTRGTIFKFFYLLKGQMLRVFAIFFLSLVLSVLGIFSVFLFQTIIDEFGITVGYYEAAEECTDEECSDVNCDDEEHLHEAENPFEKLITYVYKEAHNYKVFFAAIIFLYLIQGIIQFARTLLMTRMAQKIDIRIAMDYYANLIRLPMKAINQRKTGEYLSRFSDASIIRESVSEVCVTVVLDFILAIAYGIFLYIQNATMFFVAILIMLFYFVVVISYRKPLERINRDVMESAAQIESYIKETIDGAETIKITRQEKDVIVKGRKKYIDVTTNAFHEGILSGTQNIMSDLIEAIGNIVIMWIGFGLVLEEVISIGSLIGFFIVLSYFSSPIKNLMQLQPTIQTAVIAAERLNDIMELTGEKVGAKKEIPMDWNKISFKNVWFQYGNQESVLRGIDFSIGRGEKVAIVGDSGCGKSTLVKLLVRLYEMADGDILVQDESIKNFSNDDVRKMMSYVSQNSYFFSDSIRNNLLVEPENISEQYLDDICKKCMAYEMIQEFPFQYEMALTEMGQNISLGQRQRLAIVRAMLQNPQVLILDEATSNIDFRTEEQIINNLFKEEDLTVIMISHKLASIRNCDKIIVIENGKVAEFGKHEELLSREGIYYAMWKKGDYIIV